MVTWIRRLYLIVAWLFPVAILIQVLFVGLSLFTGQAFWDLHSTFGHLIVLVPLLLVCLSYLGRLPSPAKRPAWLVLGITLIQTEVFAALRTAVPTLAALHPVLALVLFALALLIARRAQTVVWTAVTPPPTSGQHPDTLGGATSSGEATHGAAVS
jgi:hypothetical protein